KHSGALRRGRNRRSAGAKKSQNEAAKLAAVIEKEEKRWRYARKSALRARAAHLKMPRHDC
ncbi:MAG TPA: hypothetical protein VFD48_03145, partial [Pyrinomonadaceae bacterium]|nr:hypothetical protein [Pyrinomonadaceae bacterium]